jgi:putative ABC transport system substrate-binding protein
MLGVSDPPAAGLVGSFQRPDGNVTGIVYQPADLADRSMRILQELRPATHRVALLYDPHAWASSVSRQRLSVAAARRGVDVLPLAVKERADLATAFGALVLERPDVLIVDAAATRWDDPTRISQFAIQHRFTTMSTDRGLAEAGILMAYGPALFTIGRGAAGYVRWILNGARPADLPVEQHAKFELVINLRTAKALGLEIPKALLIRADQLIE